MLSPRICLPCFVILTILCCIGCSNNRSQGAKAIADSPRPRWAAIVAVSPDQQRIAHETTDGKHFNLRILDLPSGKVLYSRMSTRLLDIPYDWDQSGEQLWLERADVDIRHPSKKVGVLDVKSGQIKRVTAFDGLLVSLEPKWVFNHTTLLIRGGNTRSGIYALADGQKEPRLIIDEPRRFAGSAQGVSGPLLFTKHSIFSPRDKPSQTLFVRRGLDGADRVLVPSSWQVHFVSVSPDGQKVALSKKISSKDGKLQVWEWMRRPSPVDVGSFEADRPLYWSSDSAAIASSGSSGLAVYIMATRKTYLWPIPASCWVQGWVGGQVLCSFGPDLITVDPLTGVRSNPF